MKPLNECTVLVTPTSYGREDPSLKTELEEKVARVIYNTTGKPFRSSDLTQLLEGVDGYIAGLDEIDRPALQNADQLKIIARYGVGVDNVDLKTCQEKNIIVTNTPGANSGSVAELTLGLILCLMRQIPPAINATLQGGWPRLHGQSLKNKTVGLIGFGHIGQCVAERLIPFGCQIMACDPFVKPERAQALNTKLCSLEDLLGQSDIISLHLPALPDTINLVNQSFLEKMKTGAYLVNTARGELIVEENLLAALESGHLAGAALDAFRKQPPDPDHPLLNHPAVIATPHMGAHADDATNQMGWMALEECLNVLLGKPPAYSVF
jgi:phosphoglycerate dehydrogenase-like enzyme